VEAAKAFYAAADDAELYYAMEWAPDVNAATQK
jgi:hypothetical protein